MTSNEDIKSPPAWGAWAGWRGRAEELAEAAGRILGAWGRDADRAAANLRVVRDYAARGVLGRPRRAGREALFDLRALAEFLAARFLLADGWPLAKIAEFTSQASLADLLSRLPAPPGRTAAELALDHLEGEAAADSWDIATAGHALAADTAAPAAMIARGLSRSARLGRPQGASRERLLRLRLAPGCEVLLDPGFARRLSPEDAETLAASLAEALCAERLRQDGD